MKTRITAIMIMAIAAITATAGVPERPLHYNVNYKWGFIDKTAASGVVELSVMGNQLFATLNGQSIPWGGRIYTVSDTLKTVVNNAGGELSQRVLYRNGWYSKPEVGQNPALVKHNPAMYKTIHGAGELSASPNTMEAVTITTDMLGFFYIVDLLDFPNYEAGEVITVPIHEPNGTLDHLQITYNGLANYNGQEAYNVVINYSYGGTMSAYPVTCYIARDTRIPLSISANLIIGHMEMVLQ